MLVKYLVHCVWVRPCKGTEERKLAELLPVGGMANIRTTPLQYRWSNRCIPGHPWPAIRPEASMTEGRFNWWTIITLMNPGYTSSTSQEPEKRTVRLRLGSTTVGCMPKLTPYIFPLGNPGEVEKTAETRGNSAARRRNILGVDR